jgi:hypothetical protein
MRNIAYANARHKQIRSGPAISSTEGDMLLTGDYTDLGNDAFVAYFLL